VPQTYKEDPALGNRVHTQRALLKTGKMDPERKAKLNEIGFEFCRKDKLNKDVWNLHFEKLCDSYEKIWSL
jgi:hypothetical protein